ncbi:hypothetical protein ACE103_08210 [Bradyrhizobium sp. ma5]|uniref:hypothetical protein n=1 Tax=Bradyrhizobium sp. ma5 TaxID=3344828 RepID=UPI0035D3EBF7
MTDDTIPPFSFPAIHAKKVTAAFDGGKEIPLSAAELAPDAFDRTQAPADASAPLQNASITTGLQAQLTASFAS